MLAGNFQSRNVRRAGAAGGCQGTLFSGPLSNLALVNRHCIERGKRAAPLKESEPMEYLLLIHSDEKAMQAYTQEETGSVLAAYGAYMKAMADAGVIKGG